MYKLSFHCDNLGKAKNSNELPVGVASNSFLDLLQLFFRFGFGFKVPVEFRFKLLVVFEFKLLAYVYNSYGCVFGGGKIREM